MRQPLERKCEVCGKTFSRSKRQIYCSPECARQAISAQQKVKRRYLAKHRAERQRVSYLSPQLRQEVQIFCRWMELVKEKYGGYKPNIDFKEMRDAWTEIKRQEEIMRLS